MRHLQDNTRALERYINKVHEELRRRIKFCGQRLDEQQLVLMLLEYVDHEALPSSNKENSSVGSNQRNSPLENKESLIQNAPPPPLQSELLARTQEVATLKEQMRVEAELTRQFFKQLRREAIDPDARKHTLQTRTPSGALASPNPMLSSVDCPCPSPFQPFDQEHVLLSPKTADTRLSRVTSFREGRDSRAAESEREKSKTFARLRKVEALFCRDSKKALSRNKSLAESWGAQEGAGMAEENQNLKAIQNNLVTHLSIMERSKNTASIEDLVHREERLRRKEAELRELERALERREKALNGAHMEALRRERSSRAF